MADMLSKKILFLILSIAAIAVVFSVVFRHVKKQDNKPIIENNNEEQIDQEKKHLLEDVFEHPEKFEAEIFFKEKVDTSDWIYYENEVYSLYYPKELELIKNPLNGERENWFKYNRTDEYPIFAFNYEDYSDFRFNYKKNIKIKSDSNIKIVEINGIKGWLTGEVSEIKIKNKDNKYGVGVLLIVGNEIVDLGLIYEYNNKDVLKIFNQIMSTVKFK